MRSSLLTSLRQATALLLVYMLPVATCPIEASALASPQEQAAPESVKLPTEQLDSLVAPIALYPDPLLAQVLVASTYPLEVIQLQQFLDKNKGLKDKALADAVQKQDWDPAVQSLAALPDVVKILSENIKWTTDLGNVFLAQQNDVMDAVQRMRAKAKDKGQLKSSQQQKVETKVIENKSVIVIEPSSPQVVYVPSYDPVVVYGAPAYPYYPMAYPPGYAAAGMALSFGVGMMVGAAWGGGWCCNTSWGGGNNNININNNNNFVNNSNRQNMNNANRGNRPSNQPGRGGSSQWQHNPQHRGGAPYGDRKTASQFGGSARGDSMSNRQASARQNQGRMQQSGMRDSGRGAGPSTMDRGGRGSTSGMDRGGGGFGGDRAGSRDVSRGSGSGAFGGASSGMSGRSAGASQSRGASSMSGGRSGGGGGGGSRSGGGGGRSGGGRRR